MREMDCDLHFHGPYSGGVSKNMLIPVIAGQAKLKGLNVLSSSDILHEKWFSHVKENLVEEENGIFRYRKGETNFILGTEAQDIERVHHCIYFPDYNAVLEAKKELKKYSSDMDLFGGGRPRIKLNGERIASIVNDSGGIIGPAHAFTPYFGVYAHFDSLKECYGEQVKNIYFIELGLSADSYFADLVKENHNYSFVSFSDAHSPWPYRMGREFTRMKLKEASFKEVKRALKEKEEKLITLNVGLNPREGKYHCTACNDCFTKYSLEDALRLKWKCMKCGKTIKRGVRDRILMLAEFKEETHPSFRPPYIHSIPLAEIIQIATGTKQITSETVQKIWNEFVEKAGSEIKILIDYPIDELKKIHSEVGEKIDSFRKGFVLYIPGGGGNYGKPIICKDEREFDRKKKELEKQLECKSEMTGQKSLKEF